MHVRDEDFAQLQGFSGTDRPVDIMSDEKVASANHDCTWRPVDKGALTEEAQALLDALLDRWMSVVLIA